MVNRFCTLERIMSTSYTFNWSDLDRDNLFMMLNSLRQRIVGKTLAVGTIQNLISKHLRSQLPIKVSRKFDFEVEKGQIWIGGVYHSDLDQEYFKAIEVSFNYNPGTSKIKITQYRWTRLCILFADTVLHEIIHMRQYRTRRFMSRPDFPSDAECAKQRAEQSYLGNRDEIDAYGFNLACELYDRFGPNFKQAMNYLENGTHKRNKRSVYYAYLKAFDFNYNHNVIKRLQKRVKRYLPYAVIGKPFKTADWLYG